MILANLEPEAIGQHLEFAIHNLANANHWLKKMLMDKQRRFTPQQKQENLERLAQISDLVQKLNQQIKGRKKLQNDA